LPTAKLEGKNHYFPASNFQSGKSFSMFGPDISDVESRGIIPRACSHIFEHISNDREGTEYTIKCSFLEIYKETVRDLLNTKNSSLRVRDTPERGVWVQNEQKIN
jgi:hypothetical protein